MSRKQLVPIKLIFYTYSMKKKLFSLLPTAIELVYLSLRRNRKI